MKKQKSYVEIEKDKPEYNNKSVWLKITHNGYQWTAVLVDRDISIKICKALKDHFNL